MSYQDNRNIPTSHPGHGQGPAGASLSDILTAIKNVAVNISNLTLLYQQMQGQSTAKAIGANTLVKTGAGWVARVSVTTAPGSAQAYLVDTNNAQATGPVIFVIPDTIGMYQVNLPFSLGLLVVTNGVGVTVSYS